MKTCRSKMQWILATPGNKSEPEDWGGGVRGTLFEAQTAPELEDNRKCTRVQELNSAL